MQTLALTLIFLLLALWWLIRATRRPNPLAIPFERQTALFNISERTFKTKLHNAVSNEYDIYAKVRLADLIKISGKQKQAVILKAKQQSESVCVDFVLIDKQSSSPRCVVQLSDKADRTERQKIISQACRSAKLPLIDFDISKELSTEIISKKIGVLLEPTIVMEQDIEADIRIYIEPANSADADERQVQIS